MPCIRIHYPSTRTLTTRKERKALSDDIVAMYTSYGLPAFYVVILYYPLPDDHIVVGGRSDERENADPNEKPMVRLMFDHIARTIETPEDAIAFFLRVDKILKKHILDQGSEYEYHLIETPREFCKMNGMYLPPNDSEAEAQWAKDNRPSPFVGMEKPMPSIKPMNVRGVI